MTRAASDALTPLDKALASLLRGVRPVAPEEAPIAMALGLVAAEDVTAPFDVPSSRCAVGDGWAVEGSLVTGASPYAPVTLAAAPIWAEAGEALAGNADAILPPDAVAGSTATEEAAALEGVREPGDDAKHGACLLAAGRGLTSAALPVLLASGIETIGVRRPRIRIVVTGEAQSDAVSPMLNAMIAAAGGASSVVSAPDEPKAIADALMGAPEADAVFVIGGTGFGRTDSSVAGLMRVGEVRAHGIALRPGSSAAVGAAAGRPVLLLPGRCEAALAVFLTLGAPLLGTLAQARSAIPWRARLLSKIVSTIGLSEVVFVRRNLEGDVEPLGGDGLPLNALALSDGAVLVGPEREGYPQGAEIEVVTL